MGSAFFKTFFLGGETALGLRVLSGPELVEERKPVLGARIKAGALHESGSSLQHVRMIIVLMAEVDHLNGTRLAVRSQQRRKRFFKFLPQLGEQLDDVLRIGIRRVGHETAIAGFDQMKFAKSRRQADFVVRQFNGENRQLFNPANRRAGNRSNDCSRVAEAFPEALGTEL